MKNVLEIIALLFVNTAITIGTLALMVYYVRRYRTIAVQVLRVVAKVALVVVVIVTLWLVRQSYKYQVESARLAKLSEDHQKTLVLQAKAANANFSHLKKDVDAEKKKLAAVEVRVAKQAKAVAAKPKE